jgi:hypothetical protein
MRLGQWVARDDWVLEETLSAPLAEGNLLFSKAEGATLEIRFVNGRSVAILNPIQVLPQHPSGERMYIVRIRCHLLAVAVASLTLVAFTEGADPAPVTLRCQFKAGEKLLYSLEQDQDLKLNLGGVDIDVKAKLTYDMTWTPVKVDDKGNAEVKVAVGRVKLVMDTPTGKSTVDSEDKTEPEDTAAKLMAPIIKGMAHLDMTLTIDSTGAGTKAAFSKESLDKLKELGNGTKDLDDMFSPDTLKSTLLSGLTNGLVLPTEAVEKGKTWTHKTNEQAPYGKAIGETTYTYQGEVEKSGKKLAHITSVPMVKIEPDPNAKLKMKVKDSNAKGTFFFDNASGRVVESTTETKMKIEMEVLNMQIPGTVMVTSTLRLKNADKSKE